IQRFGQPSSNEVLIALEEKETSQQALDRGKTQIINALQTSAPAGKQDLNNASSLTIFNYLLEKDPQHLGTDANQRYITEARTIADYRDKTKSSMLHSFDELKAIVPAKTVAALQEGFFLSNFGVRNVKIVKPQIRAQLKNQTLLTIL